MNRALTAGAALLITIGTIAGCADTGDGVAQVPSETPSSTPTPIGTTSSTPTSPETATQSPTSDAFLTTAGWGDIKPGKAVPDDTELATWNECGFWFGDDSAVYVEGGKKSGAVTQVEVWGGSIQTKSGAHIGTTRDELEALFPKAEHPDDRLYIVKDDLGQVVFDVDGDKVVFMRVLPPSVDVEATGGHGFCD